MDKPLPPAHLTVEQSKAWLELVDALDSSGVLDRIEPADYFGIEIVANQIAFMRDAEKIANEQGRFIQGANGFVQMHPALKSSKDCARTILQWSQKLGLSPKDRQMILADAKTEDDLLNKLADL